MSIPTVEVLVGDQHDLFAKWGFQAVCTFPLYFSGIFTPEKLNRLGCMVFLEENGGRNVGTSLEGRAENSLGQISSFQTCSGGTLAAELRLKHII